MLAGGTSQTDAPRAGRLKEFLRACCWCRCRCRTDEGAEVVTADGGAVYSSLVIGACGDERVYCLVVSGGVFVLNASSLGRTTPIVVLTAILFLVVVVRGPLVCDDCSGAYIVLLF